MFGLPLDDRKLKATMLWLLFTLATLCGCFAWQHQQMPPQHWHSRHRQKSHKTAPLSSSSVLTPHQEKVIWTHMTNTSATIQRTLNDLDHHEATTPSSISSEPSSSSSSLESPTTTTGTSSTRRSLMASLLALTVGHTAAAPSLCQALPVDEGGGGGDDEPIPKNDGRGGKPFAPLVALLPATRLKYVVDQMYDLSNNLLKTTDQDARYQILVQMNSLWVQKPQLFQNRQERIPAKSTTAASIAGQITTGVSTANKQQYQSNRQNLEGGAATKMMAMWNQADVERQWGMLQYQESKMNAQNELRAALTTYTSQLEYSAESYLLTANAEDRKRLIRNDALPSLTAVITSDLDLRDLYRNDFVTAMEDAEAELTYQLKQGTGDGAVDVADVVELLEKAHSSLQKWFDLVAAADVREAMEVVKDEQQNARKTKS